MLCDQLRAGTFALGLLQAAERPPRALREVPGDLYLCTEGLRWRQQRDFSTLILMEMKSFRLCKSQPGAAEIGSPAHKQHGGSRVLPPPWCVAF